MSPCIVNFNTKAPGVVGVWRDQYAAMRALKHRADFAWLRIRTVRLPNGDSFAVVRLAI